MIIVVIIGNSIKRIRYRNSNSAQVALQEDSQVALQEDSPVALQEDSPVALQEDSQVALREDSPVELREDSLVELQEDSQVVLQEDSPVVQQEGNQVVRLEAFSHRLHHPVLLLNYREWMIQDQLSLEEPLIVVMVEAEETAEVELVSFGHPVILEDAYIDLPSSG